MATTAATLVQRVRKFLRDWPEGDVLTAIMSSTTSTTMTVADATIYSPGWVIQIDSEAMQVRTNAAGTSLGVLRAARGTTGATHANGATILVRPRFLDTDILEALNSGINASFPWIYQPVIDESLVTTGTTYEYTIPNLNGSPIPFISEVSFKETGDLTFRNFRAWDVIRGGTPAIKLRRPLPTGTLRVRGFGPVTSLADTTVSLSTSYPSYAEDALTLYAAQYLLASGEAARVREDTGARDQRENANRPGSSMSASNAILQRFQRRLMDSGLPPMPKHSISAL